MMDVINICTQFTGFFASKSIGAFKKIYEWTWVVFLLLIPVMAIYTGFRIKSFKLVDIVTAVQGPAFALRLSFCVVFFCLRKPQYMQILEEKREVTKWMKMLVFKSDASISVLRKSSKTCITKMFFYFPFFISVLTLFTTYFLPYIIFSVQSSPTNDNLNDNATVINIQNGTQGSASTAIETVILLTFFFILISTAALKRRCVDFLIFKMYLHVIQETDFLTEALTAIFTERRAFFQKVNLSNWLKCKERLMR
jgi:hypothetical protein